MVRGAIVIGVGWFERVVYTVIVDISAGGDVDIQRVVDAVVVGIVATQCRTGAVFNLIVDTIAVAVKIAKISDTIAIGVG